MLWSLIKILLFIGIVAALTYGAGVLMETGGGIRVAVGTLEFNLGPLQATVAMLLLLVFFWIVLKLASLGVAMLKWINGDETALRRWMNRRSERLGFEALSDGLMALAGGEGRMAMAKAARAERYLKRPELTNLVTAQAAEMMGDAKKAEEVYRRLVQEDRTRFVGVRGIMKQKLAQGDTDTAMKLAEKAFAMKPRHEEIQDVLLKLQADKGDWSGARQTLGAKLRYGTLPRDVHRRRDAVLALGEAKAVIEDGATIEARETAIQANKLSPDLVPAAVMAADSYLAQGNKRNAARVLTKAWGAQPHPDLAVAFAGIEPDETPEQRVKRFQPLTRQHPTHPETRMLLAEMHLAASDFPSARRAIGDLAETDPTARSLAIMAAIERGEGAGDAVVKGYLAQAVTASRGPQWVCDNCHNIPGAWEPVCSNCGSFDTLTWRVPPAIPESAAAPGAAVLPMVIGAEEQPAEVVAPEAPADPEPVPDASKAEAPPAANTPAAPAVTAEQDQASDEAPTANGADPDPLPPLDPGTPVEPEERKSV